MKRQLTRAERMWRKTKLVVTSTKTTSMLLQETLLPYHECSRRDDYTNLVPVTLEAGHY